MDRTGTSYLLFHYAVMVAVILLVVEFIERAGFEVPLVVGAGIAVVIGVLYPRVLSSVGVAPERWER